MKDASRKQWKIAGLSVLTGILIFFPLIFSEYDTSILAKFIVFGIFALSLDLIWGYSGIVNFGHAIFFGGGAYVMGAVLKALTIPGATYVAILAAIVLPMLLSAFLGYFLFYGRVSGVFFGVVTLALTGVVQSIVIVSASITGGMNGLFDFPSPRLSFPGLPAIDLSHPRAAYYVAVAAAVACFFFARSIVRSDFGRVLRCIQENEERVEFLGYNVPLIKLAIFTISCGMAGLAGALYVPVELHIARSREHRALCRSLDLGRGRRSRHACRRLHRRPLRQLPPDSSVRSIRRPLAAFHWHARDPGSPLLARWHSWPGGEEGYAPCCRLKRFTNDLAVSR